MIQTILIEEPKDGICLWFLLVLLSIELQECFDDLSFVIISFLLLPTLKYVFHSVVSIEAIILDCEDFD